VSGKLEGVTDRFVAPGQVADQARYNALLSTRGNLEADLKKDDGSSMPVFMVFNGETRPAVTIGLGLSDWIYVQKGEVNGQELFMNGKMSFDGDMTFLMNLQQLI